MDYTDSGYKIISECGKSAYKWAEAFMQHYDKYGNRYIDESMMQAWFANAMENMTIPNIPNADFHILIGLYSVEVTPVVEKNVIKFVITDKEGVRRALTASAILDKEISVETVSDLIISSELSTELENELRAEITNILFNGD